MMYLCPICARADKDVERADEDVERGQNDFART